MKAKIKIKAKSAAGKSGGFTGHIPTTSPKRPSIKGAGAHSKGPESASNDLNMTNFAQIHKKLHSHHD